MLCIILVFGQNESIGDFQKIINDILGDFKFKKDISRPILFILVLFLLT